jgi:cytochrome c-type biogenesis protein
VSAGDSFRDTVLTGPLLLSLPVAVLAGLVSFLSPCVLPLVPGYLSYVTGLTGVDLAESTASESTASEGTVLVRERVVRGRVLLGATLFVLGFSAVFITEGALFGGIGAQLGGHQVLVNRVLGLVTILLGLAFMGLIPGMQREVRVHALPAAGLAGAPLLGILFGAGWTPCLGPTLGAVQTLAFQDGSAGRGAILTAAYCLGLGIPFLMTAVAFRRAMAAFAVVKRHYDVVLRVGGGLLVLIGLLLVSGVWQHLVVNLQTYIRDFNVSV